MKIYKKQVLGDASPFNGWMFFELKNTQYLTCSKDFPRLFYTGNGMESLVQDTSKAKVKSEGIYNLCNLFPLVVLVECWSEM